MKTLSLIQPWATLVAIGAKKIETRSWSTRYRGPLAIHAGKKLIMPTDPDFMRELVNAGLATHTAKNRHMCRWCWNELPGEPEPVCNHEYSWIPFPLGAIIAIVNLAHVCATEQVASSISRTERLFGDYSRGRFAWHLDKVQDLDKPVPAKGSLGLWEWKNAK